ERRVVVAHPDNVADSARRGRPRAALHRLGVGVTGLAQVCVQVDEPRTQHRRFPSRLRLEVDNLDAIAIDARVDRHEASILEPDIAALGVDAGERVDDADAAQHGVHAGAPWTSHAPSTPSTSTRRTATRSLVAVGTFL